MRSELNYAGKNLSEFGMWFDNSKVYKKPSKRFMGYDIPARNGTLYQSENKFNNVIIEFDCFIKDNFDQNYNDLVNYLNSFETYQKLVNSYNGNMYRMALFHEAIEVDTGQFLKDGRFKLFFDCKPQEFYTDGAEFERIIPHSDIYTGNPAELVNEGESSVISLRVPLEPIQNLNGYDSPWVGGAGKNKLNVTAPSATTAGITFTVNPNGSVKVSGTATGNAYFNFYTWVAMSLTSFVNVVGQTVKISGGTSKVRFSLGSRANASATPTEAHDTGSGATTTLPSDTSYRIYCALRVLSGQTVNETIYPMVRLASETDASFAPYENICPITGHTSASVTRTVDGSATDYTINLNGTRYGGTVDLATGVLTVTHGFVTLDGSNDESWSVNGNQTSDGSRNCVCSNVYPEALSHDDSVYFTGISNQLKASSGNRLYGGQDFGVNVSLHWCGCRFPGIGTVSALRTYLASNPLQVCYPLNATQTVQLTAQQISLLTGTNYISSSGEVTVTTSTPLILKNPSPMTAKPVFKFTDISAPFTVSANGETIISFQNAIRLVKSGFVNNMFFNAIGTNLIMQKQGTPNYEETSFLIDSGWLPAGRYYLATMPIGNLEVTSMDGTHLYSSGGTFTLTDITQVKVWYVITPDASTPQNFNFPIFLRPMGTLYVDSELMDCYMLDGDTAYSFNECVSLPKDFLQLDERTVITITSGAVGFIAPNWWRL